MAVTPEQKAEFIRLVSTGIYGVRAAQQVGSYKKAMQREALKDAEFAAEWDQAKKDGAEALLSLVNDDAVAMLQTPHTERTNPGVAALHTSAANSLRWAAAKMNSEFGDKHMVEHTGRVAHVVASIPKVELARKLAAMPGGLDVLEKLELDASFGDGGIAGPDSETPKALGVVVTDVSQGGDNA